jgi:isopenicillin N synthase-like dioxygenase
MPVGERRLPTREKGNLNEAFFVKRELGSRNITLDHNQWPSEVPGFRETCEAYAAAVEALNRCLLPAIATALGVKKDYFDAAFTQPLFRLVIASI